MSTDYPTKYSLPYHVTTLQKMYGPIPVLPTKSNQMETKPVYSEQCYKGQVEEQEHIIFWHKVHTNIGLSFLMRMVIILKNAESHTSFMSSRNMK
jgi:hypothetical protein